MSQSHSIEATIKLHYHDGSDDGTLETRPRCVCCPNFPGHCYSKALKLDYGEAKPPLPLQGWGDTDSWILYGVIRPDHPSMNGRRVRITVELLDEPIQEQR